ncbi:MAG: peptide-methionine (S)-S-oxide reductase MsrA [Planctomycetes bacterium]|nr:peptide-methionine (S)-S-oxide reductase MsrA [Planctomycetota bacterium]
MSDRVMVDWARRAPQLVSVVLLAGFTCLIGARGAVARAAQPEVAGKQASRASDELETATFGGGCFWCTEAFFEELTGVYSVVAGYSGGFVENPSYQQICTGTTGHAEVIQIVFNARIVPYEDLLEVFWKTHDPTTLNRQGADVGPQYRSVIFHHNERQRQLAEQYKRKLDESRAFDAPIVTEISPFQSFYPAENYHQDYFEGNPKERYCQVVIAPKMTKFRKVFREKLKAASDAGRRVTKSNAQWKAQLTDQQFRVTRQKEAEQPFSGEHVSSTAPGTYLCVGCGLPLYDAATKYDAGSGWPSFWAPVNKDHVMTAMDRRGSQPRTELKCTRCGAHLGHLYNDGPPPTGSRHSVYSAALKFEPPR